MTDRETSALLDELAGRVPVGPAPTAELVRAGRRARRRRTVGASLAVAAGVAVLGGGVVVVAEPFRDGGESARTVVAESEGAERDLGSAAGSAMSQPPEDPTAERTGALEVGPGAGCAVGYSPEAVRERDFAFDGVVTGIGPSVTDRSGAEGPERVGVTFAVTEWFSGGEGPTVTVDLLPPALPGGSATSEGGPSYGIGSRLLVSGADRWDGEPLEPLAWTCGFTRYHDEATAASWR